MSGMIRVGRGGAGNFISQKDVQEAERAQNNNDPEAQKLPQPQPPSDGTAPASAAPEAPVYVRSGRGGSGNYAEPPTIDESRAREEVVSKTKAAVDASLAGKPRVRLSGRGGAGNWTDGVVDKDADDAADPEVKQQQIEDQVAHDIEAMLAPPPKTYHQHDRDLD
ncbi:hypothetical protein BD289DRAFT_478291 [Coniella lustricola]|uniref:Uncharacterized protein n=1 Tax=Coniella lustricola TaxID=2025994 RepID=A0A2T3AMY3_9PEZI|nr:hypothetical protein BD289DRAFT_478291 [Coniella lustricola]